MLQKTSKIPKYAAKIDKKPDNGKIIGHNGARKINVKILI